MRDLLTIFLAVFVAELGDKTQLATLLFASENKVSPAMVFVASAGALVLSSAIAVALGYLVHRDLTALPLKLIAGTGFVIIGLWTIAQSLRGV